MLKYENYRKKRTKNKIDSLCDHVTHSIRIHTISSPLNLKFKRTVDHCNAPILTLVL